MSEQATRRVSLPLGVGVFVLPYIFAWVLLGKGYSSTARAVAFAWMIGLLVSIGTRHSEPPPAAQVASAPKVPEVTHSDPVFDAGNPAPQTHDPKEVRQYNTRELAAIADRLRHREQNMKGYYSTPEALAEGNEDVVKLGGIVAWLDGSEEKDDKKLGRQAKALLEQVSGNVRRMFASVTEERFVKNGMDVRVRASGRATDQLTLTYALMSKPMVYQFQNEAHLDDQAKGLGFKRLVYTNGFEGEMGSTWSIDLTKS